MITEYEVGQIPAQPLSLAVRDDYDNVVNLTTYSNITVEVLGSDNEKVDLAGSSLFTEGARNGNVALFWPKGRSVFTKHGEYVLRLALYGSEGTVDFTRDHTIKVRKFGGKN